MPNVEQECANVPCRSPFWLMREFVSSRAPSVITKATCNEKFDVFNCNAGRGSGCRECHPCFARRPTINHPCECVWVQRAARGCGGAEGSSHTCPVPAPPRQTKQAAPLMLHTPCCHPSQQAMPCVSRSAPSAHQTYHGNYTRAHSWLPSWLPKQQFVLLVVSLRYELHSKV